MDIIKLRLAKDCLANVVTRSPCFTRSLPLLMCLRWLPVQYRIIVKICTITYQVMSCKQPTYLHPLLTPVRNPIQHWSPSSNWFVLKVKTNIGIRGFCSCTYYFFPYNQ